MTPSSQDRSTVDALSEDLRELLADTHSFLDEWLQKADQTLSVPQSSEQAMISVQKRLREFEEEKRQWSLRRKRELQFIEEKAALLADAWLRLEAEQRDLGITAANVREPNRASSPSGKTLENSKETTANASSLSRSLAKKSSHRAMTDDRVAQFQRLKQEVQSNPAKR